MNAAICQDSNRIILPGKTAISFIAALIPARVVVVVVVDIAVAVASIAVESAVVVEV